jgi:20S proteasome alpha/beta subunit
MVEPVLCTTSIKESGALEKAMTIVVTVKVTDGIVLGADSAATFYLQTPGGTMAKIYNHANKIFNLRKVWSIGAMVYGSGGIGAASVETLSKDLRRRFSDRTNQDYYLRDGAFTIEEVAIKARKFFYEESFLRAYNPPPADFFMGYRVCGYSAGHDLPEIWEFGIVGPNCDPPSCVQNRDQFGLRWAGENEALDRLILGVTSGIQGWLVQKGFVQPQDAEAAYLEIVNQSAYPLYQPAMPIQDAIGVARFAVETAIGYAKYGMRQETIGGPIELAAITKHEGFKWVARKHYYSAELNRETTHGP